MCICTPLNRRGLLGLVPGVAALALVGVGMAGCGGGGGPAPIRWGRENCDYCGMIIDDPHCAGEVRGGPQDKLWKFDDIGCAAMFLAKQPWADDPATGIWVGDNDRGNWLDGRAAWYVGGKTSPMAYGFIAIAQRREGAMDFAAFRAAVLAKGSASRCDPTALVVRF